MGWINLAYDRDKWGIVVDHGSECLQGIFWSAEEIVAFQEVLHCMELVKLSGTI